MNAVKDDVVKLVGKELESANKKFPMFRSAHEGCAVILEEMEEACDAMVSAELYYKFLWKNTKGNPTEIDDVSGIANNILICAVDLACEAIQVAAMAKKFQESMEIFENKERSNT